MLLSPIFAAHYQGQLLGHNLDFPHFTYGGITLFAKLFQVTSAVLPDSVIVTAKPHISLRIRFRLFPFRSPLLGKSLLISLPRGTKMLQFPRFDLLAECTNVQDSHSDIPGSKGTCASPGLIAACHVLHLSSSLAIHLLASSHRQIQPHITRLCTTITATAPG